MLIHSKLSLLGLSVCLALTACQQASTSTYQLGSDHYKIPNRFLAKESVPGLPASQHASPILVLNPGEPLQDQILILVQTASEACKNFRRQGDAVGLCQKGTAIDSPLSAIHLSDLERVNDKYAVTWRYFQVSTNGNRKWVATCTKTESDIRVGMCSHMYRQGELIFTVEIDEDQLSNLPEIQAEVKRLLYDWQIR
jgi:hypothetical protein